MRTSGSDLIIDIRFNGTDFKRLIFPSCRICKSWDSEETNSQYLSFNRLVANMLQFDSSLAIESQR
jgi:hypothetical protein